MTVKNGLNFPAFSAVKMAPFIFIKILFSGLPLSIISLFELSVSWGYLLKILNGKLQKLVIYYKLYSPYVLQHYIFLYVL